MIKLILSLTKHVLAIWEKENAEQYLEELTKLEKEYDKENDKNRPDHNVLDTIERDIVRLGKLVDSETKR